MKNYLKLLGAVAATSILASCGGSGSDGDVVYTSFGTITSDGEALDLKYAGEAETAFIDLPDIDGATYQGFVGGDLTGGDLDQREIIGQLTLEVDFATPDVVDGDAYNFLLDDSSELPGELTLASGLIQENGSNVAEINADLTGELNGDQTDIALIGTFLGDQYEAVEGGVIGDVGDSALSGGFIAER